METALLTDEQRLKRVEYTTNNGAVIISREKVATLFGFLDRTISVHQLINSQTSELSFEVPSTMAGGDHIYSLDIQFGKTFVVHGVRGESSATLSSLDFSQSTHSVITLLRHLPDKCSLKQTFTMLKKIIRVEKLPKRYDGNLLFELPNAEPTSQWVGLENKFDGHIWINAMTSNISSFT